MSIILFQNIHPNSIKFYLSLIKITPGHYVTVLLNAISIKDIQTNGTVHKESHNP
jgi:hypothetical protein